jgi:hypothetical protein
MYTYQEIHIVNELLCAMAHKATEKDYVVLTQFINSSILDALVGDSPYTSMVAKFPQYSVKGVEILLESNYFEDREGVVLSKDGSYIGGWMDSDNLAVMLNGISRWFEYMEYKEVE